MSRIERAMTLAYMGQLITEIEEFLDDENNHKRFVSAEGYLGQTPESEQDTEMKLKIDELETLADGLLITGKGQPDFAAHRELNSLCRVFIKAGEQDSFGWLTGVIVARNFKFVYG